MRITDRRPTRKKPNLTAPQRHFPHSFWFPRTALPFGNTYPAAYSVAPAVAWEEDSPEAELWKRESDQLSRPRPPPFPRGGNSTEEDGEGPPLCAYKRPRPLADRTQSEGGERAKRKDKKGPTEVSRPLAPTRPSRRGSPVGGEKTDTVPKDTGGCIPFEEVILYFFGGETIAHIVPSPFSLSSSW